LQEGHPDEALRSAEAALDGDPSVASYDHKAYVLNVLGEHDRAIETADLALKISEHDVAALVEISIAHRKSQRLTDAIDAGQRAVSFASTDPRAHNALGLAFLANGNSADALKEFTSAAGYDSGWYGYETNKGDAAYQLDDLPLAIGSYLAALDLQPKDIFALNGLGWSYLGKAEYSSALTAFDSALREEPVSERAMRGRGEALNGLAKYSLALEQYQELVELYPGPQAFRGMATVYINQGELDDALNRLNRAIDLDGSWSLLYADKANLLRRMGHRKEAFDAAQRGVRVEQPSASSFVALGMANYDLGKKESALEAFQTAVSLAPEWPYAHATLAYFGLDEAGRTEDALKELEVALSLDDDYAPAWFYRAWIVDVRFKKYAEAVKLYRRAGDLYRSFEAAASVRANDDKNAVGVYREMLKEKSSAPRTMLQVADTLSEMRCSSLALSAYDRSISLDTSGSLYLALVGKANVLASTGEVGPSQEQLRRALEMLDGRPIETSRVASDKSVILERLGRHRDAVNALTVAVELGFDQRQGLLRQAGLLIYGLDSDEEAMSVLTAIEDGGLLDGLNQPDSAQYHWLRAMALKGEGNFEGAVQELALAAGAGYDPLSYYAEKASIEHYQIHDEDQALEDIERALADPRSTSFHSGLKADIVESLQGAAAAAAIVEEALRRDPANVAARRHLSSLYFTMGDPGRGESEDRIADEFDAANKVVTSTTTVAGGNNGEPSRCREYEGLVRSSGGFGRWYLMAALAVVALAVGAGLWRRYYW